MTQLSLFPEIKVKGQHLYQAIRNGNIDNQTVAWASERAFEANKLMSAIINVDKLTIIPLWKELCQPEVVGIIEQSQQSHTRIYVKMTCGKAVAAGDNMLDMLSQPEINIIDDFIK